MVRDVVGEVVERPLQLTGVSLQRVELRGSRCLLAPDALALLARILRFAVLAGCGRDARAEETEDEEQGGGALHEEEAARRRAVYWSHPHRYRRHPWSGASTNRRSAHGSTPTSTTSSRRPYEFTLIAGGRSNLTYTVTDAERPRLRAAPPAARSRARHRARHGPRASDHRRRRHHRRARAARRSGLCTDDAVNGAPFYVMGYVDGVVLDEPAKAEAMSVEQRTCGERAPDRRARRPARGRRRRGRPRRLRQARRLHRAPGEAVDDAVGELEDAGAAGDRRGRHACSRERMPEQHGVSDRPRRLPLRQLPHRRRHGRIAAVLDWELCTLGDPLADVGYLGVYWCDPGRAEPSPCQRPDRARRASPRYDELARALCRADGTRSVAASTTTSRSPCWRLAVISEGVYARYLHGAMGDAATWTIEALDGSRPGPTCSPNRRSKRCGGWRERDRRPTCWRAGSADRSRPPASPATRTGAAAAPAWSSSTRSRASRRRSRSSPTTWSTPGSRW